MESDAVSPQELLGTCRRMEIEAAALYQRFAEATRDPALVALWRAMIGEETQHAAAIDRIAARRDVRLPTISRRNLAGVVDRLSAIRAEAEGGNLDDATMLSIAAALEFSEMDDLFGSVCRAAGVDPDQGRAEHIAGIVEAAARLGAAGKALRHLLASLIRLDRRARNSSAGAAAAGGA